MSSCTTRTDRQFLEDYADLIQRLLPSVPSIAFLDRSSRILWSRGDDLTPDVISQVSTALTQPLRSESRCRDSIVELTPAYRIATLTAASRRGCSFGCLRSRDSGNTWAA